MGLDVEALGALVRSCREERALSASTVARRWTDLVGENRSPSYVYNLEAGKLGARLGQRDVIAIAEALRMPPEPFLLAAGLSVPEHLDDAAQVYVTTVFADPFLTDKQKDYLVESYRITRGLPPGATSLLPRRDGAR